MTDDEEFLDSPLTAEQQAAVSLLDDRQVAAIDNALLAQCKDNWRKVAYVVGKTMMMEDVDRPTGIPDTFYAIRLEHLAHRGLLEIAGSATAMRFAEVRLTLR